MVFSRECINNGCHNNTFRLKMVKERLFIKCSNCGYEQAAGILDNWKPFPQCKCGCNNFRVDFNEDDDSLDIYCAKCGRHPIDCIEVEQKEVQSMSKTRKFMYDINKKLDVLIQKQATLKDELNETNNSLCKSGTKCYRQPKNDIEVEQKEVQSISKTQRFMYDINKKLDLLIQEQGILNDKLKDKFEELYWQTKYNND